MVSKGQSLLPNACSLILRVIRVQCGWTSQFSKDGAAAIPFLSKKSRRSKKDLFCPYSITIDHFQKKVKRSWWEPMLCVRQHVYKKRLIPMSCINALAVLAQNYNMQSMRQPLTECTMGDQIPRPPDNWMVWCIQWAQQ